MLLHRACNSSRCNRLQRPSRRCNGRCGEGGGKVDISRVLFLMNHVNGSWGNHLSRTSVTDGLKRHVENGTRFMANRGSWTLLPTGVYRASTSRCCWCALTAPLHPYLCRIPNLLGWSRTCWVGAAIGGVFLWHSPHGYPHWALPSKSGHWGARTFLSTAHIGMLAAPRLPRLLSAHHSMAKRWVFGLQTCRRPGCPGGPP